MSGVSPWRDSGNLERAVETAGGQEAFDAAVAVMLDDARGWRLAEMRKRRGMTQDQVAARMGVSVARVSQIVWAWTSMLQDVSPSKCLKNSGCGAMPISICAGLLRSSGI